MCGIVGYLGEKSVVPLIIDSLRQLEYRGYDSAGVAFLEDEETLSIYKASGKLVNLENILPPQTKQPSENGSLHLGIGHIRWATHGAANDANAHPHTSCHNDLALVHNGIIENFSELKATLSAKGHRFCSDTDTECVVHLVEEVAQQHGPLNAQTDLFQVIHESVGQLRGAYAMAIISKKHPNKLYAVRNHAPLVIGVGDGEFLVASDVVAVAQHTNKIIYLKDQEIAEISPEGVRIMTLQGKAIEPTIEQITTGPLLIDKKGYKHFMLKEIHEQPDVVRNSLSQRLLGVHEPIQFFPTSTPKATQLDTLFTQCERIVIVGCGTSFNAGLVGKYFIEELVRVPVEVETAGEFRYRNPILNEKTLVVGISQSGETADTLEALRLASKNGAKVLVVTNREDSTMAREADGVLPVRAGVEVSVCATKSFLAQIVMLYLIGLRLGELRQSVPAERLAQLKADLLKVPTLIEAVLSTPEPLQTLAKKYGTARDILFIARGVNYPVALEGALKLKEISYIHAEGYSGSELKHGPIAMLDQTIPVLAVLAPGVVFEKMISNCQEAKARDARVIAVSTSEAIHEWDDTFEDIITLPAVDELLSPLLTTLPLQLIAYYMAEYLGKDVDQPRNLAKSVTVE